MFLVGVFSGYHANLDRSNMIWMTKKYFDGLKYDDTLEFAAKNYGFPLDINDLDGFVPETIADQRVRYVKRIKTNENMN